MRNNKLESISLYILAVLLATSFAACTNDDVIENQDKGRKLTFSAKINANITRMAYTESEDGRKIAVDWEAEEKITVVSFNASGITAIDEFTSTGMAGRDVAEFSGTYNGNVGDRKVCIYPALTSTVGATRYSGLEIGATAFTVNYPMHAPSKEYSTLKDWDIMIGEITASVSGMEVKLNRQITVLKLGVSGSIPYSSGDGRYITHIGVAATDAMDNAKLFAGKGTLNVTTATYTGNLIHSDWYPEHRMQLAAQQTTDGETTYYLPLLADGTLTEGDKLCIYGMSRERWSYGTWEKYNADKIHQLASGKSMLFQPGFMYILHLGL